MFLYYTNHCYQLSQNYYFFHKINSTVLKRKNGYLNPLLFLILCCQTKCSKVFHQLRLITHCIEKYTTLQIELKQCSVYSLIISILVYKAIIDVC